MVEDKLLSDFETYLRDLNDIKDWLTRLYYHPEFSSVFNRPSISMLITGTDFLITNITKFKDSWLDRLK